MIIVEERMLPVPLPEAVGHVACIVGLTDGKTVMAVFQPTRIVEIGKNTLGLQYRNKLK